MTVCIDTDVLIDCLRGVAEAQEWLRSAAREELLVPGVVAMELVAGVRDKNDLQRVRGFVETFTIVWHDARDFAKAYELLAQTTLSNALSIPDCLIAAFALGRSIPIYTFNIKHYRAISELDVRVPYERIIK